MSQIVARRGRPAVYTGKVEKEIVKHIKKLGLSGTQKVMQKQGIDVGHTYPGTDKPKRTKFRKVSMLTLSKIAERNGVVLKKGRRAADEA